jgi:hypothetical protein
MLYSFQDHMKATGAKPGYYVATIIGGNTEQGKRQRVLDHSSALFSQGFRWTAPDTAELWLGSVVRTYRFHSDNGEGLRKWAGTFKRGREVVEIEGYAPDLDRADEIMKHELGKMFHGRSKVTYYGVKWV